VSAELLRKAAREMREKATSARGSLSDNVPEWHAVRGLMADGKTREDAAHIAAWHPAVALAVANWLDTVATSLDGGARYQFASRAVAVARAFLGADA